MRIDQLITLVWAGNVLLVGGTGYVGWTFWQQKQSQKGAAEVEWPATGGKYEPPTWPGPVTNFARVWDTPLNGPVPPPPVQDTGPKVEKLDPKQALARRLQITNVVEASSPFATLIVVNDTSGAGQRLLVVGEYVDEWQLVGARVDEAASKYLALFRSATNGDVEISSAIPTVQPPPALPFVKSYEGAISPGEVPHDKVAVQAYRDATTGEWQIPWDEVRWLVVYGEEDVLQKTKFVERPQGLEIASPVPRGPLENTRDLTQGDIVVSINGTPVKSLADVTGYLRGAGRDETRYVVVIERDGARRTQVYNVTRRRTPEPAKASRPK